MQKSKFTYKKDDGSVSERELIKTEFLKESANYLKTFDKDSVNYVSGFELKKDGLSEEQIRQYEEVLEDFYDLANKTMAEFFQEQGLDAGRLMKKSFIKANISDFKVI